MIEPIAFKFNKQTASNNYFQKKNDSLSNDKVQANALTEFKALVKKLEEKEVSVLVFKDNDDLNTPDAIFPNNWISFHENKSVVLYPLYAKNRRYERRIDIIDSLRKEHNFSISKILDYSEHEDNAQFLEGTGSLILDRENKICYACLSERTNKELVVKFCEDFSYTPILFNAFQTVNKQRLKIYHTNVIMNIGITYAVVCFDAIDNVDEKEMVRDQLLKSGKDIIEINESQLDQFAGNMLQVMGDQPYLVMSLTAYNSLSKEQISRLESHNPIIYSNLSTIENYGGGSARCMMAEIFLPTKKEI